jgi:LysM repeat protein
MPYLISRSQGRILLDIGTKTLILYNGDQPIKKYTTAIGRPVTPTPLGNYTIVSKIINPGGILGTRWLGLSLPQYGIHGTNNPSSIGTAASKGCIRLYNHDVEDLFSRVSLGTPVQIINSKIKGSLAPQISTDINAVENTEGTFIDYIVQPGDSFWKIAQKYDTNIASIKANNILVNPNGLHPGQKLKIPKN